MAGAGWSWAVGVLTGRHVDGGRKTLTSGQQRHNHGERKTLHQVATVWRPAPNM